MKARVEPGDLSDTISAPASKSMTQRAYAAALLHKGTTIIQGAGHSDDEQAALQIIQQLGAKIVSTTPGKIEIYSTGEVTPITGVINCNESGLSARLFSPIAALSAQAIRIDGAGSLPRRPMEGFKDIFAALQVHLPAFTGYIPFTLQGPVLPQSISVDASGGSQLLSGLLFALTAAITPLTIEVSGLKSKPYIDMTLAMLAHFGKPVAHDNYKSFYVDPALFTSRDAVEITIEGDWSGAAGLLVAGAIAGSITIRNLDAHSLQADRAILTVLEAAGATVSLNDAGISVKQARLKAFEFDSSESPDLFPVLAILAACCEGESYITGIHRLFHKESNRAQSISEMLQNFDVPYAIEDDALCITGANKLQGTIIDPFHDHRIVMAAAIGALRASGPVDILHAQSVNKSYPDFFKDLALCGGKTSFIAD
jgi:3-phosphoshikimate 1-carboxyvinyltransferase